MGKKDLRTGDLVKAVKGSVSDWIAEGRIGLIVELRDPKPSSGNRSNNLVIWGTDTIFMGLHPENVYFVERPSPTK